MPSAHSHSIRQAVNEGDLHRELCAATQGYGGVIRFARRVGLARQYIQGMLYGNRRVSSEVAGKLGYELRWVKKELQ